jgi:hypothetical protein
LATAVIAHLVASAVHFTDNAVRFDRYPEPSWLNPPLVAVSWFVLAALAVFGAIQLSAGSAVAGRISLGASAFLAIIGLGHYLLPGAQSMDALQHGSIGVEAVAAVALLVSSFWPSSG